ncbi:MAG: hypothetical protein KI793_33310 [Rivularia sp. (in: Bacteria)]|nr:hypothetical protein [Rivularia sp. MS3]
MKLFELALLTTVNTIIFLSNQVIAYEWNDTPCKLPSRKVEYCKETKGDVFLKGKQGTLHTYTFPNGQKFYWFYGLNSQLCKWKDTYVRQEGQKNWFVVSPSCEDNDNYIDINLTSGQTLFRIYRV